MQQQRDREDEEEKERRRKMSHDEWLTSIQPAHVPENPDEIQIFGYYNQTISGSAYIILNQNDQPKSFRFPPFVRRSRSEQYSVMMALKQIENDKKNIGLFWHETTINIVTTQPTILTNLTKIGKLNSIELTIAKCLRSLGKKVKLTFPSRKNITTKQVRASAIGAAENVNKPFAWEYYSKSAAQMVAKQLTNARMDERFAEKANSVLQDFFKKWTKVPKFITTNYNNSQLFSAHGGFNKFLGDFHVRDKQGRPFSTLCWCDRGRGTQEQTVQHILLDCPYFEDIHKEGFIGNTGQFTATITSIDQYIYSQRQFEEHFNEQSKVIMDRLNEYRDYPHLRPHLPALQPTQTQQSTNPQVDQ